MNSFSSEFSPVDSAINRRRFLGIAALGAGVIGLSGESWAQGANPRRIDVHHHFVPEVYSAYEAAHATGRGGKKGGRGGGNPQWVLAKDLEDMDQNGTATAILSITTPGFTVGDVEDVRKVIRGCNEAAAKLRADHPGRFGSFASIPITDTEGALHETEYAFDTLKADGIGLYSDYGDKWLGHASFAPVYEELNRRKAIVYVHPRSPNCCGNLGLGQDGVPNEGPMIEFGTDTTRTIASVLFSGTSKRYPNITWIFSHGGGTMPYLIERFFQSGASADIVPGIVTKGQGVQSGPGAMPGDEVLGELRKMYYDTAQASNPVALDALKKVVHVSQIVFGTDYWYRTAAETGKGLTTAKVFNAAELRAVDRGNVERILPRYKGAK
jgi:predicted TIM-barrel fold metal-dependent hydrolase